MKEQEYKVMCKRDYFILNKDLSYESGDFCYARIRSDHVLINKEPNMSGGFWIHIVDYMGYFYTPAETQNITRTELIDKILK